MNQLPIQTQDYTVLVRCYTFNHSKYIEDALNGFVIQQTDFPFVCLVVDDASTDGEQTVIKSFLDKECDMGKSQYYDTESAEVIIVPHRSNLQCTMVVYFLKENHYSVQRSKVPYSQPWRDKCKYEAICEGDDYWIDKNKLRKQVDYMECHYDCVMTCTRTRYFSRKQNRFVKEQYCRKGDGILNVRDVIYRQGLYISTCSIMLRSNIYNSYPNYCKDCLIGDYPLQIYAVLNGQIYYFDDSMSVYCIEDSNSWMGKQASIRGTVDDRRLAIMDSTLKMLSGFSMDYPTYSRLLYNKICEYINRGIPYRKRSSHTDVLKYMDHFGWYINHYNLFWKFDLYIRRCRFPGIRYVYTKLFMKDFYEMTIAI